MVDRPVVESSPPESPYREITLADLVRVVQRRKWILLAVFMASVLGGLGLTVLATPEYESEATLIPLAHQDIIQNWLGSRLAAEIVVEELGDQVLAELFPAKWDGGQQAWKSARPSLEQGASALAKAVTVDTRSGSFGGAERLLVVTATMTNPTVARDVAAGYIRSLDDLRPFLVNVTRQAAFEQYYDGQNEQAAQQRAEVTARQMDYWIPLDSASTPSEPSSPNVTLNLALAVVLGLVLGIFAVFIWEWLAQYRADTRRLEVPPSRVAGVVGEPGAPPRGPSGAPGPAARRRYG